MNTNISTTSGFSLVRRSDSISLALLKHLSDSQEVPGTHRFKRMYISPTGVQEATNDMLNELTTSSEEKPVSDDENAVDLSDDFMEAHNRSILKGLLMCSDSELKLYLSLPQSSWESNPILFWNSYTAAMPGLRYFIAPGSSCLQSDMRPL
ncbi:uncharacterized protein LOC119562368 isoform X2 [Drosophila subpulchrella]|uniref:uncharacterized protein LOC119562368 isoform X2 n=1 Tax=Drosophila subpulchrella TaxID=1486046 RepID=UPI0018A16D41|nr:uncharacterized protein LOC119562368 isoform X2 [Drosophila subpulchrella]